MIIAKVSAWCKAAFAKVPTHVLIVGALILASGASFALGILTARERAERPQITLEELGTTTPPMNLGASAEASNAIIPAGGEVVASKSGTKYYFPWCGTVKRIKEENKVWFASREAAEAAGYEPAANCKGL